MLAIVIPYYKKNFFKETLISLAKQTDQRFKVYIGNDNSPENPEDLIIEFSEKLELVYTKFPFNLGQKSLVKHWERCLSLTSNEEWVVILGDDDIFENNVVEEFYKNIEEVISNGINVIRFASVKTDKDSFLISDKYTHPKIESSIDFIFRKSRSSLSEYIFKKDKLRNVWFKDFPFAWYSDKLAVMEVSDFGNVYTINSAVVKIRVTTLSISGNVDLNNPKLKATFMFNYYLLNQQRDKFNTTHLQILKKQLNKCYIYNKKEITWYFKILNLYIQKYKIADLLTFHKEILSFVFKTKNL